MNPAKKLLPETEQPLEQVQEKVIEGKTSKTQHVVKLLIIMLLTYVIIFL